jgi:hypothetical protein
MSSRELPPAAMIEIIEHGKKTAGDAAGSVVVPDEVRINGVPLLVEYGSVKVHEMAFGGGEVAKVTLTLFARRITIAAELDLLPGDASDG